MEAYVRGLTEPIRSTKQVSHLEVLPTKYGCSTLSERAGMVCSVHCAASCALCAVPTSGSRKYGDAERRPAEGGGIPQR